MRDRGGRGSKNVKSWRDVIYGWSLGRSPFLGDGDAEEDGDEEDDDDGEHDEADGELAQADTVPAQGQDGRRGSVHQIWPNMNGFIECFTGLC